MSKIPQTIQESWHEHLQPLFDDPKMEMIKTICSKHPYYPSPELVFRVFRMPLDKIKVVILGQDPYPQPNQAIGLAFAVSKDCPIPASLRIIMEEVLISEFGKNTDRTLQNWVNQGVFLLNTALTVQSGQAGSHSDYWIWFTRKVVEIISKEAKPVWLLWGSKAKTFGSYISNAIYRKDDNSLESISSEINDKMNFVLEASHPAAQAYDKFTIYKFSGCNHFRLCNKILEFKNQTKINW